MSEAAAVVFSSRRVRARLLAGIVTATLTVGGASVGIARATSLPGPSEFHTGLVDDPSFESGSSSLSTLWLGRAQALGSTSVRLSVLWSTVAPSHPARGFQAANPGDPGYDWTELDSAVRAATAEGQAVVLMVWDAPAWAEAPHRPKYVAAGAWNPRPAALADFAHALATRYSGGFPDPLNAGQTLPRVDDFQAWNEPNLPNYLMPQWTRGPHRSIVATSPGLYRSLLNAFYVAVKAVQPDSFILAAGTAPYGDPPGVDRMKPLTFLRGLFCVTPALKSQRCPDPPHFDALDHHPYSFSPTYRAKVAGNVGLPELDQIRQVLRAAQRAGHALPLGPKSLWVTEIDYESTPQNTATLNRQSRFLSRSFYDLWRDDVSNVFWFQIRDPVRTGAFNDGGGLYTRGGSAKPAAAAFRFPFIAFDAPNHQRTIWGKAPASGSVVIAKRAGGRWVPMFTLRTTAGGVFYARRHLSSQLQLRAQQAGITSLGWPRA